MGGFGSGVTLNKQQRCNMVFDVMAAVPDREWTCTDIYMKIHSYQSMTQVRSALSMLTKEGRIEYVRKHGQYGLPSTWRVVLPKAAP